MEFSCVLLAITKHFEDILAHWGLNVWGRTVTEFYCNNTPFLRLYRLRAGLFKDLIVSGADCLRAGIFKGRIVHGPIV